MASILITDDHPLFMEGLSLILRNKIPALQIHQAERLETAKYYVRHDQTIVLMLLDRTLPGIDSLEHLQELWDINPNLRIAIISASCSRQQIKEAMEAGVTGFIPKDSSPDTTIAAIQNMVDGGFYIPEQIWDSAYPPKDNNTKPTLSPRQVEVLALAAAGCANKEIANQLHLSEGTVKQHFNAIFKMLKVEDNLPKGNNRRAHAIQTARMRGIIH